MEDIVPQLYEKIKKEFFLKIKNDKQIQEALKEETEASFSDVSLLSRRVGMYASVSLIKNINKDTMPEGKIYWNILERTVLPIMKEVYELVNQMAFNVQKRIDKEQNIGIKPVKPKFQKERIEDIMNKIMVVQEEFING